MSLLLNPSRFATGGDPYFSSVSLLLHGDGTNGSTTFTDSSGSPKTVSVVGSGVTISTAQSVFGGASINMNGSGNLSVPDSAAFQFGSGDFTIEALLRSGTLGRSVICNRSNIGDGWALQSSALRAYYGGVWSDTKLSWTEPATGTFYFLALVRNGGTMRAYIDGVQVASGAISGSWRDGYTSTIGIGCSTTNNGENRWDGYMEELRVTKGVCRYPGGTTFTPPVAAFPNA